MKRARYQHGTVGLSPRSEGRTSRSIAGANAPPRGRAYARAWSLEQGKVQDQDPGPESGRSVIGCGQIVLMRQVREVTFGAVIERFSSRSEFASRKNGSAGWGWWKRTSTSMSKPWIIRQRILTFPCWICTSGRVGGMPPDGGEGGEGAGMAPSVSRSHPRRRPTSRP